MNSVPGQILGQNYLPIELHPRILNKIVQEKVDFALEVTKTTQADVKGRMNFKLDLVLRQHFFKVTFEDFLPTGHGAYALRGPVPADRTAQGGAGEQTA